MSQSKRRTVATLEREPESAGASTVGFVQYMMTCAGRGQFQRVSGIPAWQHLFSNTRMFPFLKQGSEEVYGVGE